MKNYDENYLPKLKDGTTVTNLGEYMETLLENFIKYFGLNPDAVEKSKTVAGGHKGIGTFSNIFGRATKIYSGVRFLDLIKNKIIQDLSGIPWPNIKMSWGDPEERKNKSSETEINKKVMFAKDVRDAQKIQRDE